MRYVATCSPDFLRYFSQGVNAQTLAQAPVLVFNRKDALQARFAHKISDPAPWQPPVWWVPSTRLRAGHAGRAGLDHESAAAGAGAP